MLIMVALLNEHEALHCLAERENTSAAFGDFKQMSKINTN